MASSTVPALKLQLRTNLAARAGLSGVQVTYGPPTPQPGWGNDINTVEYVWIGDVQGTQAFSIFNASGGQRDEEYDLKIWISVTKATSPDDYQTAGNRAFALMAEIENEVRADHTVTGTVQQAEVTGFIFIEDAKAEMNEARLEVTVHVKALI